MTLALSTAVLAQGESPPLEYQVKAAFLYNFAKFVDWPPEVFRDPDAAFVICVVDEEAFAQALEQASTARPAAAFRRGSGQAPKEES